MGSPWFVVSYWDVRMWDDISAPQQWGFLRLKDFQWSLKAEEKGLLHPVEFITSGCCLWITS